MLEKYWMSFDELRMNVKNSNYLLQPAGMLLLLLWCELLVVEGKMCQINYYTEMIAREASVGVRCTLICEQFRGEHLECHRKQGQSDDKQVPWSSFDSGAVHRIHCEKEREEKKWKMIRETFTRIVNTVLKFIVLTTHSVFPSHLTMLKVSMFPFPQWSIVTAPARFKSSEYSSSCHDVIECRAFVSFIIDCQ